MTDDADLGEALADMVKNAQRAGFSGAAVDDVAADSSIPCCDYRDHGTSCSCTEHPRSLLHPYGSK